MSRFDLAAPDAEWEAFRARLEKAIGVPLWQYKEPQMKRRLANLMRKYAPDGWPAFADVVNRDPRVLEIVRDTLTINVSEFFRQPDRYADLQKVYIPELLKERQRLKIWSAGCSIGSC